MIRGSCSVLLDLRGVLLVDLLLPPAVATAPTVRSQGNPRRQGSTAIAKRRNRLRRWRLIDPPEKCKRTSQTRCQLRVIVHPLTATPRTWQRRIATARAMLARFRVPLSWRNCSNARSTRPSPTTSSIWRLSRPTTSSSRCSRRCSHIVAGQLLPAPQPHRRDPIDARPRRARPTCIDDHHRPDRQDRSTANTGGLLTLGLPGVTSVEQLRRRWCRCAPRSTRPTTSPRAGRGGRCG